MRIPAHRERSFRANVNTHSDRWWKRDEWNTVRVRVVGDVPHATVWINDQQVSDTRDTTNHAVGGMLEGPIAIQVHGGAARWRP